MNKNDDFVPVTEFITTSRKNLEVAAAVYEQYEAAREKIIGQFFDRLGRRLVGKLPGWSWEYAPAFYTERYGRFGIGKESWLRHYMIVVEAYDWGASMIGGVWRNEEALGAVPRGSEILAAVKQIHSGDRCQSRKWYEAEVTLRSPATDWRTPEALWRIHTDDRFLDEVEGLFLGWVKATEVLVDSAINRLQKSS